MKITDNINNHSREALLKIIAKQQQLLERNKKALEENNQTIEENQRTIRNLEHRISTLLRHRFAKRLEKMDPENRQLNLFDEADLPTPEQAIAQESESPEEKITVPEHQRKKRGRKPLPEDLPRLRKEYTLSEQERRCECGEICREIGEEKSEQLEIIPAQMYVIEHVKKKYACRACEANVIQAKAPAQPLPKSNAGAGLLSHILVSKFCDHLPLHRQTHILKRCGIDITRATLGHWVIKCATLLAPLVDLLHQNILSYDIAYADETKCQVLKEPGRRAEQHSYMWCFGGGPPEKFAWIYQYHPGRRGLFAKQFFEGFTGYCHVDGYAGYHELTPDVTLSGCMVHARRKFFDVAMSAKKKKGLAHQALEMFAKLYAIEKKAKQAQYSPEEIKALRTQEAKPILETINHWCQTHKNKVPPKSPIATAITYILNQWHKLITYCEDGRLEIDNNRTERAIKPFVIGRKNWLFSNSVAGAEAGAIIFTLIETCKHHNIDPYAYLRFVLMHAPVCQSQQDFEKLLPYHIKEEVLNNDILDAHQALLKK